MNPQPISRSEFEAAITRALEQHSEPVIPADFASRVAAALPAQRASRSRVQIGRSSAVAGAVVLTGALFALAPHAAPSFTSFAFDLELMVLAQLAAIAWFLTPSRKL